MQIYVRTCSWIEVKISKLKRCVLPNYETDALFMNCNEAAVYETSHRTSSCPEAKCLAGNKNMFTCVCSSAAVWWRRELCSSLPATFRQLLALWLRELYPQRTWGQTSAKVNFTSATTKALQKHLPQCMSHVQKEQITTGGQIVSAADKKSHPIRTQILGQE